MVRARARGPWGAHRDRRRRPLAQLSEEPRLRRNRNLAVFGRADRSPILAALTGMRVTDLLRTMDIFEALPTEELEPIAQLLRERRLGEAEVLCRQGEPGDA